MSESDTFWPYRQEVYLDDVLPNILADLSRCPNPRRPQARHQNAFGGSSDPDESPEATQQVLAEAGRCGRGGGGGPVDSKGVALRQCKL